MKKFGSFFMIKENGMCGIGKSKNSSDLQPFVVWDISGNDVLNAIFFRHYEDAERNYMERSRIKRIERGEL